MPPTTKATVRVYGEGPRKDEGGSHHIEERTTPAWVIAAWRKCRGCHQDFYNGRANCTGNHWCFMLKASFARLKGKPSCYC